MNLTSERLLYIPVTEAEREGYMAWYTNDEVMKYITGKGLTKAQANERFAKAIESNLANPEMGLYVVKHRDTNKNIGIAKLAYFNDDNTAEVGYGMMPDSWGKGYATEMLLCLMAHCRTLPQIKTLVGIVKPENKASVKVLTKQGFVLDKVALSRGGEEAYYKLDL
ncbi:GNAT family N-acetyltransferase [uncultured Microscilla sp.]|uniref:GNAT family N-acetyltransferase n=1 Tax=uncultured Microscilla sp. TaxID=432653 RepID=UPI0026362134|nr:GNAT family N-acetyltransferase [uncultured Microscilla sp.]